MADPTVWEVNTPGTLGTLRQSFVATAAQTLFTFTTFTYPTGRNALLVFINGVFQTDYAETSTSSITFGFASIRVNDVVNVVAFGATAV